MMYEACAAQLLELLIYGAHAGQRARQAMQMLQGEIVVLYLLYCLGGSATPGYISRQLNRSAPGLPIPSTPWRKNILSAGTMRATTVARSRYT